MTVLQETIMLVLKKGLRNSSKTLNLFCDTLRVKIIPDAVCLCQLISGVFPVLLNYRLLTEIAHKLQAAACWLQGRLHLKNE